MPNLDSILENLERTEEQNTALLEGPTEVARQYILFRGRRSKALLWKQPPKSVSLPLTCQRAFKITEEHG